MPHLFRMPDGTVCKPGKPPISLTLADGTKVEGTWAGSAREETLDIKWLSKPGHVLAQTEPVAAVAVRNEATNELNWGDAPAGARLLFVLKPLSTGKNGERYSLALMVTTAATPAQEAFFNEPRFALFGTLNSDGTVTKIPPLDPPPPKPPLQSELF